MTAAVSIKGLSKTYATGVQALKPTDLDIKEGEIFALLGPNGAGKTTLIAIVCGIVNPSGGQVTVGGFDIIRDFRKTRKLIGLVPQEIATEAFETVFDVASYSRGLFGLPPSKAHIEKVLKSLSLWEKKDEKIMTLSGGMKRRVMIAKALSHEPRILFLDEPSAGVDVELRKDLWNLVRGLKAEGVTIILTTHYIEEAEQMADRVGVINKGELILVEEKTELMQKLGQKELVIDLASPIDKIPAGLEEWNLTLAPGGEKITYTFGTGGERKKVIDLLRKLDTAKAPIKDFHTSQSSLEDIFVSLVKEDA